MRAVSVCLIATYSVVEMERTEAEQQDKLPMLWLEDFPPTRQVEGLSSRGVEEAAFVFDSCCPGFPYARQQPRLQEEVFQRGFFAKEES
jgi:hypothetical protein